MEWKVSLIASLAFALYVICPRMSAMMVEQAKMRELNIHTVIVLGALMSISLFMILAGVLVRFGMTWAIIFAAVGDFAAAALLGIIDLRTGVELAIITAFVYIGIRLASVISKIIV